ISDKKKETLVEQFEWPAHSLHVLGLIQDGFTRRLNVLSDEMRSNIGEILTVANLKGISADTKWALDVAGSAPNEVLTTLLSHAFNNPSQVLRYSAYRQIAKLNDIPSDLGFSIRETLSRMVVTGR